MSKQAIWILIIAICIIKTHYWTDITDINKLPTWLSGKEPTCQCRRHRFSPWVGKIPWRRKWQPTPVFLPENFQGQRSLAGYSPWDHKESDTNKQEYDLMLPRIQLQRGLKFLLNHASFIEHFPQPCICLGGYNVGPTFLYRPVWGGRMSLGLLDHNPLTETLHP